MSSKNVELSCQKDESSAKEINFPIENGEFSMEKINILP